MYERVNLSGSVVDGRVILDPFSIDPTPPGLASSISGTSPEPGDEPGDEPPFVALNAPFDPHSAVDEVAAAELVEA